MGVRREINLTEDSWRLEGKVIRASYYDRDSGREYTIEFTDGTKLIFDSDGMDAIIVDLEE